MKTTTIHLKRVKRPGNGRQDRHVWSLRWFETNGKQRFETVGDCKLVTKRQAEAIRRRRQSEMDGGTAPRDQPTAITIDGFRGYLADSLAGQLKPAVLA